MSDNQTPRAQREANSAKAKTQPRDAHGRFLRDLVERAAADDADEIGPVHPVVWVLLGVVGTLLLIWAASMLEGVIGG